MHPPTHPHMYTDLFTQSHSHTHTRAIILFSCTHARLPNGVRLDVTRLGLQPRLVAFHTAEPHFLRHLGHDGNSLCAV
jgi:hypothetical protein